MICKYFRTRIGGNDSSPQRNFSLIPSKDSNSHKKHKVSIVPQAISLETITAASASPSLAPSAMMHRLDGSIHGSGQKQKHTDGDDDDDDEDYVDYSKLYEIQKPEPVVPKVDFSDPSKLDRISLLPKLQYFREKFNHPAHEKDTTGSKKKKLPDFSAIKGDSAMLNFKNHRVVSAALNVFPPPPASAAATTASANTTAISTRSLSISHGRASKIATASSSSAKQPAVQPQPVPSGPIIINAPKMSKEDKAAMNQYALEIKKTLHGSHKWTVNMTQASLPASDGGEDLMMSYAAGGVSKFGTTGGSVAAEGKDQTQSVVSLASSDGSSVNILAPSAITKLHGGGLDDASSIGSLDSDESSKIQAPSDRKFSKQPIPPAALVRGSMGGNVRKTFMNTTLLKHTPEGMIPTTNSNVKGIVGAALSHSITAELSAVSGTSTVAEDGIPGANESSIITSSLLNNFAGGSQATTPGPPPIAREPVIVDCLLILPRTQVIIGACSDRYFRFWDIQTMEVLCSCLYISQELIQHVLSIIGHNTPYGTATNRPLNIPSDCLPDEVVKSMQVSDSEDILIGKWFIKTIFQFFFLLQV